MPVETRGDSSRRPEKAGTRNSSQTFGGPLDPGPGMITKPFPVALLATRIREVVEHS
ncbi:MAG: hypothetical protein PGN25_07080 [Methylorubrum populi]